METITPERRAEILATLKRLYDAAFPGSWQGVKWEGVSAAGSVVLSQDWLKENFSDAEFSAITGGAKDRHIPASRRTSNLTDELSAYLAAAVNLLPELLLPEKP